LPFYASLAKKEMIDNPTFRKIRKPFFPLYFFLLASGVPGSLGRDAVRLELAPENPMSAGNQQLPVAPRSQSFESASLEPLVAGRQHSRTNSHQTPLTLETFLFCVEAFQQPLLFPCDSLSPVLHSSPQKRSSDSFPPLRKFLDSTSPGPLPATASSPLDVSPWV